MTPIYIHSGMTGAPQYANADGNINAILKACLVDGFNIRTATSAAAAAGVLTLNFASDPGFEALQTIEIANSAVATANGVHKVLANTNNQVTVAIAGLADGTVGSSGAGITVKQASAGWTAPFSSSTVTVFRPATGNRHFLRCEHVNNANFSARGYEVMTAADTGTEPFPTIAQKASFDAMYNYNYGVPTNAGWFAVVTPQFLILSISNGSYGVGTFMFGDLAEVVKPNDSYGTMIHGAFYAYIARSYSGEAGAVLIEIANPLPSSGWPSPILGGERFVPYVPVYETNILRGFIPNLYQMTPHAPTGQLLNLLSNVSGINGRMKYIARAVGDSIKNAVAIDEDIWT